MPVTINEFEVVTEAPAPVTQSAPNEPAQPAAPGRGATPHEIEAILRREKERLARVLAH
jgi:hypothetical protein